MCIHLWFLFLLDELTFLSLWSIPHYSWQYFFFWKLLCLILVNSWYSYSSFLLTNVFTFVSVLSGSQFPVPQEVTTVICLMCLLENVCVYTHVCRHMYIGSYSHWTETLFSILAPGAEVAFFFLKLHFNNVLVCILLNPLCSLCRPGDIFKHRVIGLLDPLLLLSQQGFINVVLLFYRKDSFSGKWSG